MNQKIKAPGQHIKVDKLRLKDLNGKKHWSSEASIGKAQLQGCTRMGAPLVALPQREAHPKVSLSSRCRKRVSIFPRPQNTKDKPCIDSRRKTEMNHQLLRAVLYAPASGRFGKVGNRPLKTGNDDRRVGGGVS